MQHAGPLRILRRLPRAGWSVCAVLASGCLGLTSFPTKDGVGGSDSGDSGATAGALTVDKASLDFGTVAPGSTATQALVLSNSSADTLRVAAAVSGAAVYGLSDASIAMAPGGDSTLSVTFSPTSTMTYDANLGLDLEDGTSLTVPITGVGGTGGDNGGNGGDTGSGTGALTITPSTKDYGSVNVGSSGSYSFTVANGGSAAVLVDSVASSNPAFTVSGGTLTAPSEVPAGSSKTVSVVFAPTDARAYTSTLTLHTDLTPANVTASLSGTGVQGCTVCSPLITVDTGGDPYSVTDFFTFGSPDSRNWTIRNDGDEDLTVSSVSVNNDFIATCGTFQISGFTGPKTVTAGNTTSFTISYSGTSCIDVPQKSLDANVVHILSNDPSQPDYVIEVGGIAL